MDPSRSTAVKLDYEMSCEREGNILQAFGDTVILSRLSCRAGWPRKELKSGLLCQSLEATQRFWLWNEDLLGGRCWPLHFRWNRYDLV